MIVLDTVDKSLGLRSPQSGFIGLEAVVSYWSVVSNVWTPHQVEWKYGANMSAVPALLLATPSIGETKVVENIWLHITDPMATPQDLNVVTGVLGIQAGPNERTIAQFTNPSSGLGIAVGTTLMMSRQGVWTRQMATFASGTISVSQNLH